MRIIEKFGGIRPMARALDVPHTTVSTWKKSGVIPARRQADVLALARRNGITLEPADFFEDTAA